MSTELSADPRSRARTPGPRRISVVDSHTCGQPTRVIWAGVPALAYDSIAQARDLLRDEHDWLRRLALYEPHGHPSLFGAVLVAPVDPDCAAGVVFMDAAGYHEMCGHATIGVVTTLVELGRVPAADGEATVALETPAGRIETSASIAGGRARSVSFVNQPAFLLETVRVELDRRRLEIPVAFGGQWYAFVDARALGLAVEPAQIPALVRAAAALRPLLAAAVSRPDPRTGAPPQVENVLWFDDPALPGADGRNMPVNRAGGFDRSPCGTGTSARLALLHARGELAPGRVYVNSSVLGTSYRARILATTPVGELAAVVPEITGSAWVTGRADRWSDPDDPLGGGFLL